MRLFLVRHGESVDNLAGVYAGSRDSALTNHGIEQARRLGTWLAVNRPPLSHIFASPLQRAFQTAKAIHGAQHEIIAGSTHVSAVQAAQQLVERDFGFYEGKPAGSRHHDSSRKTGRGAYQDCHKEDPGFVDVESKDALGKRGDDFINMHLLQLFDSETEDVEPVVVIVSHGILLTQLWRRLLSRFSSRSVTIAPGVVTPKGQYSLEHLGGWSNTGFLELAIRGAALFPKSPLKHVDESKADITIEPGITSLATPSVTPRTGDSERILAASDMSHNVETKTEPSPPPVSTRRLDDYSTTILTIDGKQHLQSLKRTRGGIGRARYDEKQKTMTSFFKRSRTE